MSSAFQQSSSKTTLTAKYYVILENIVEKSLFFMFRKLKPKEFIITLNYSLFWAKY